MIVPVEDVEAIVVGELDDATLEEPFKVGSVHAIQTRPGERARCYVEIVERWAHAKAGWVHRFVVVPQPHVPRLLHKNPGAGRADYTSSPGQAMADEGEAPSKDDMALFRQRARVEALKDREDRRQVQRLLSAEKRVAVFQHEARLRKIDIRSEVRLIQRLKEQGKRIDNVVEGIQRKLDGDLDRAA